MSARIRRWAYSPRTPQVIAQRTTEGLGLVAASAGIILTVSGIPSALAMHATVALAGLL
jgi:hypothetical protein